MRWQVGVTSWEQVLLFPQTEVVMQTLTDRMGEDMRLRGFALKTQQANRCAVAGIRVPPPRLRLWTACAKRP